MKFDPGPIRLHRADLPAYLNNIVITFTEFWFPYYVRQKIGVLWRTELVSL